MARRRPRRLVRLLARANQVVAPSPFLARELGALRAGIQIIPNPLPVESYQYRLRKHLKPSMVWMRALHSLYNPELAVLVLARVLKSHPEATLSMYGPTRGDCAVGSVLKFG